MMKLGEKELKDIANGSCLLASGGGGTIDAPQWIIPEILKFENQVTLIDLEEIKSGTQGAVVACMGSPKALKDIGFHGSAFRAWDLLEQTINTKFSFSVSVETGSVNTFIAMLTAARMGIPIVDADGAGRAVPTLAMLTFSEPIPISPFTIANEASTRYHEPNAQAALYGDTPSDIENLARPFISVPKEFDQTAGVAGWAMDKENILSKHPLISGTITRARKAGRALRKSNDPIKALEKFFGPDFFLLFKGKLTHIVQAESGGFDRGVLTFKNDKKTVHIVNQNENMIAWDADKNIPLAMAPDSISYVNEKGIALSNADLEPGDSIYIIGIRADKRLREDPYLKNQFLTGLQNVGYYGKYVPLEQLQ
ncbi:MAG: DUF917 domain-containing protein [Desulfobacteraceae bacterium]|nr:DUF917 domain-containing protein [Desulfobacteraceae bacterium]